MVKVPDLQEEGRFGFLAIHQPRTSRSPLRCGGRSLTQPPDLYKRVLFV